MAGVFAGELKPAVIFMRIWKGSDPSRGGGAIIKTQEMCEQVKQHNFGSLVSEHVLFDIDWAAVATQHRAVLSPPTHTR